MTLIILVIFMNGHCSNALIYLISRTFIDPGLDKANVARLERPLIFRRDVIIAHDNRSFGRGHRSGKQELLCNQLFQLALKFLGI